MSAKKSKSAIDIVLNDKTSNAAMNKAIDELWIESKGDLNYQCKDGYRFIDVLILKTLDYNNIGHSEQLISKFLKQHEKAFVSVIENDITEDNPIALITRSRTSSILLKQLLDKIDFSKENIEAKPGLKMLTTTFKCITPSYDQRPSDFILVLSEKLSKHDHLNKFVNELKAAYAISNLFKHKELNDEIKKDFSLITQKNLSYSNTLYNDLSANSSYVKVISDGLNYLNKMDASEIELFKSKLEKQLICDLSIINKQSLDTFSDKFNSNIESICKKLNLDNNVKIDMGHSRNRTLEEYNTDLIVNKSHGALDTLINIYYIEVNQKSIQEKVLAIQESDEIKYFKNYLKNLKNDGKQISIHNYSFEKIDKMINKLESLSEVDLHPKNINNHIYKETMSMENLYMNISNPLIEDIFKKIEQSFKQDKIKNFNIINQIAAIAELEGIFPNQADVLKNINENCINLLENQLILSTNGEIIKNPAIDEINKKQDILSKANKEILKPLINELKEINSLFKEVFLMIDEQKLETEKKIVVKPK
jgi:hypothetical protein